MPHFPHRDRPSPSCCGEAAALLAPAPSPMPDQLGSWPGGQYGYASTGLGGQPRRGPAGAGLSGTGLVADDLYLLAHHDVTGKPLLQPRPAGHRAGGRPAGRADAGRQHRPAARRRGGGRADLARGRPGPPRAGPGSRRARASPGAGMAAIPGAQCRRGRGGPAGTVGVPDAGPSRVPVAPRPVGPGRRRLGVRAAAAGALRAGPGPAPSPRGAVLAGLAVACGLGFRLEQYATPAGRSLDEAVGYLGPDLRELIAQTQAAVDSALLSHRT